MGIDRVFFPSSSTALHILDQGPVEIKSDDEIAFGDVESFFRNTRSEYTCVGSVPEVGGTENTNS